MSTAAQEHGAAGLVPEAGSFGRSRPQTRLGFTIGVRFAVLVLAILLWWAFASTNAISSAILAPPSAVISAAHAEGSDVLQQVGRTVFEVVIALGISWAIGLALGVLLGTSRFLQPLLGLGRAFYAVPIVIVYPIMTVWFGYGSMSKIVFGSLAGVLPMMLMCASAVSTADARITVLFASIGASRRELLMTGILPASVPGVVAAMRLSGSLAFVSVIVGEMLVSTNGVGYFIANSASTFNTAAVYLGICCVVALAIILHALLGLIGRGLSGYVARR